MTFDCSSTSEKKSHARRPKVAEMEAGIFFGFEDAVEDRAEAPPEKRGGSDDERGEEKSSPKGQNSAAQPG